MVRQALASAAPPERKRPTMYERTAREPLIPFINAVPEADRSAPRKQRYTAHRIWQRIAKELPERKVAEVMIRRYVRELKRELGWATRATCEVVGARLEKSRDTSVPHWLRSIDFIASTPAANPAR